MKRSIALSIIVSAFAAGLLQLAQAQSRTTPESLMSEIVSALSRKDEAALKSLAIDQAEFKKYVWPTIASRVSNGNNTNANKFYSSWQKSSQVGVTEALQAVGGHKWEVVKVQAEPSGKGRGYQLYSAPVVTVRDETGQQKSVHIVGGLLQKDGALKVTTFYVSPTVRASK